MATREEVFTAIRNADKAGDSAAVRKLGDYLKTLPPEGEAKPLDASSTHEMALQRAAQYDKQAADAKANQPGVVGNTLGAVAGFGKGLADTVGHLSSAVVAAPVSGLAGLVAAPFVGADRAADIVGKVGNAMTYQPRSDVGQQAAQLQAAPAQWLSDKADQAGQVAANVTGSPAVGAAVNTALQAAPALIAPEARGAFGSAGRAVATGARAVAGGAKIAAAAVDPAVIAAAAAKAKAYVTGTAGLDWDALSDSLKAKLTSVAQTSGQLEQLDPAALAREAKLQSLPVPVPATRGQLMRDPVALRNEGNVSATAAGAPIRDVHLAANQALLDNLDVLKGKVSGTGETAATATTPEQVGANVQGVARGKLELAKAQVKQLYTAADTAGETLQKVDTQPILDMVEKTPDQSHFGYAKSWLSQNTDGPGSGTTIRDLEDLRKAAVAKASNGGEDAYYAGKLINAIDTATDGAGGKLYQAARAARKAQGTEFQEQGAVADLVDNSSRTDRTTALENTTKTITSGSLEDVRNIKRTLLTGGDATTRTAGRQAWRDVRAQVIQGIKDDATKSVATNVDGSPNLTPSGLKRAIDRYGPQKLDEIFGPGTTRQLNAIMDAAQTVKTLPPTAAVGSSTFANVLAFLEKGLTKVPLVGNTAVDIARGVAQIKNIGAGARQAQAATVTPLNQAVEQAAGKASRADVLRRAKGAVPLIPLSALSQSNAPR